MREDECGMIGWIDVGLLEPGEAEQVEQRRRVNQLCYLRRDVLGSLPLCRVQEIPGII